MTRVLLKNPREAKARCARVAAVVVAAIATAPVHADPPHGDTNAAQVWQAQAVRWPVAPDAVEPVAPWVPASAVDHSDAVEVTPTRAAALWLPALAAKRVRVMRGEVADLQLSRVGGTLGARITADETGVATPGGIELVEPLGPGSMWVIAARVPTVIVVERIGDRDPRLVWEQTRDALYAWIDCDGDLPAVPTDDGGAAAIRLRAGRALVAPGQPPALRDAIQLWRHTQVDAIVATLRPGNDPYISHSTSEPDGPVTRDADDEPYGPAPPPNHPWRLELSGPGALVVDARATAAEATLGGLATLEVRRDGRTMARIEDSASPIVALEPGAALPGLAGDSAAADASHVGPTLRASAPNSQRSDPSQANLGRKMRAVVPLALGSHVYEIAVSGAGLVRADARHRNSRFQELFAASPERQASRIRRRLSRLAKSTARSLGERLVGAALGITSHDTPAATTAVAMFAQLVAGPGQIDVELAHLLTANVARLVAVSYGDLERAIVLELAERSPAGVDLTPIAAALLGSGHDLPPPALLAALAPHLGGGTRSDAVAAAELAWRQHPTVAAFRAAVIAASRRTTMRRIDPTPPTPRTPPSLTGNAVAAPARWLTASDASAKADLRMPDRINSAISELSLGTDFTLDIAPHPDEPDRLAVARIYVATPADAPGPVRVTFDGETQSVLALRSLEVVEIAASAGRHNVRVDAPSKTHAFVGFSRRQNDAANRAPSGAIRKRWPVDRTFVYALPAPQATGPVRIELLGYPSERVRRHVVWLHPEAGPPRRLVLDVRAADPLSWSLDDDRTAAPPAAIAVWLPPGTRKFWLTTNDGPLYAHVSAHGAVPVAATLAAAVAPPPLPRRVELDRVTELSASIAQHPDQAHLFVERAVALLDLGEIGAARRDLAVAAPLVRDSDRSGYRDALVQLDALAEPAYLPLQPAGGPIRSGVIVGAPPTPADPEFVALARRVRRDGAAASWNAIERGEFAVPSGSTGDQLAAAIAQRAGQPRAAADRWLRLKSWQAHAAALGELRLLLDAGTANAAPVAYGIAGELEDAVTPAIQRARAAAARASRWDQVRDTVNNAGFESLSTIPAGLDEPPALALRRALLAAPWREVAAMLEPGRATTLSIEGPRTIGVEIWCRPLWPVAPPSTCAVTSTVDQANTHTMAVPHARVHTTTVDVPSGHHEIEIGLAPADPTAIAAVRFTDARDAQGDSAIVGVRPMRVFLAATDHPAEIAVRGPGAVGIEVRGYDGRGGVADIAITGPGGERHVAVVVDPTAAPETRAEPGRDVAVTRPVSRTVLLETAATYKIQVVPQRDLVAVRFATRVATRSSVDSAVVQRSEPSDGLPWPASIPEPVLVAGIEPEPRWIPSVEAVLGQDNLAALDSEFAALNVRYELAAQVRHRNRDSALFAELRTRQSGPLGPTTRVRVAGEVRRLPLGFSASLDLHAAFQTSPSGVLWLMRAIGNVSRPLFFDPRLQLVPAIAVYAAAFGPAEDPPGADPMVASVYRRDHPLQLAEYLDLEGRPFADQYAAIGINARSNDSPGELDMIGGRVMWRSLIETSPRRGGILMLEYLPTFRFANSHRAQAFWRHDLAAEIAWPWPLAQGRHGRVVVSLRGDLYPPTNISQTSHAVTLAVRWDYWHPAQRNRMPSEESLSDYVDEVPWAGQR